MRPLSHDSSMKPKTMDGCSAYLVRSWREAKARDGFTCKMASSTNYDGVLEWLTGLSDRDAFRILRFFEMRRKNLPPSCPAEWNDPWITWRETQYTMEGHERGDARPQVVDSPPTNWKDLVTPEEIDRVFIPSREEGK